MTVRELIEYLQDFNQNLKVAICTDDFYGYYSELEIADINVDTVKPEPFTYPARGNKFDALVIRKY